MPRKRSNGQRRALGAKLPTAAELAYRKLLREILNAVRHELERLLFPVLADYSATPTFAAVRQDAAPNYIRQRLGAVELRTAQILDEKKLGARVGHFAERVNRKNAQQLIRVVPIGPRTNIGVASVLDAFRDRNVMLIKSLVGEELVRITKLLENAETPGLRVEEIRKRIQEEFDVSKSKADLLARDQVLKLNGQITQTRQVNAGIDSYVWTSSKDERVRERHDELDGTVQAWNDPPVIAPDGRTGHPGDDYQCRCTAFPVIEELDADLLENAFP